MPRPRFDLADRLEHQAGNVENDGHLNAARYMREAAAALRLAAQSPEPVAWIDFADDGNVRLWTSEKHRADAEVAAGRKMTPVYTTPPADTGMREALAFTREFIRGEQIESAVVGISSMQSLGEYIDTALAASEATKSDGGEERTASNPLSEVTHRPSDPHEPATVLTKGGEGPAYIGRPGDAHNLYEDSARDTRPAEVTVEVRAKIDWWLREISDCNERMWNGSREMYFGQIDKGVDAIRKLLDTYKIGAK